MANDYCLTCCSTADLSQERFKERGIRYVCFHFELDGQKYLDDMGTSVPPEILFRNMAGGAATKTSQVSVGEYVAFFEDILKEGKDILHLTLSSGITGTYNSACIAAEDLKEAYPDRRIRIVDSLAASSGYGLLMDTLADKRDEGMGFEELAAWAEENRLKLHHWFFSTDLTFYIKGGRISKAAGFVGTVLGICPLLNVDKEGRLIPREKIRGKKKVIKATFEKMLEHAEGGTEYTGKCFISHSMCEDDAKAVALLIENAFPKLDGRVEIFPIGATIGSHTGPGTVALFFWGDERTE